MRLPRSSPALLASVCLAFACGKGSSPGQCTHNFDCAAGEACVSGTCQTVPCGGCQPDEACGSDGNCVPAQGASCADHTCPTAYPCNSGGVCAKTCVTNDNCDTGFFCNPAVKSCTQCVFNKDCAGKKDTPVCDTDPSAGAASSTGAGVCVACNINQDCVASLGSGHYCDGHACKVGCKSNDDCNATLGETCDTSTTPGKCVQCHTSSDCAAQGPSAAACDDTGHCVQCWGATQAAANFFCSAGTPECNLTLKQCVQCLPANNASGLDCGYTDSTVTDDPHDARTCNPATYACVDGCQVDSQCGCPRNAPGGVEGACPRFPDQEHCDPNRTTMAGVTGATLGACVQCTNNTHCEYEVSGNTSVPGHPGTMNGSRCVSDACVEGCDTDADCYPDHVVPSNAPKYCHLGVAGDVNNHKCVQCHCNTLSPDGTYCEDDPICSSAGKVCDSVTLNCRKKRFGEQCLNTADCGDSHDPQLDWQDGCPTSGLCVYNSDPQPTGNEQYCAPDHASYGRCGVTCDSVANNKYCGATVACPAGSQCRPARDGQSASGTDCVPQACNSP